MLCVSKYTLYDSGFQNKTPDFTNLHNPGTNDTIPGSLHCKTQDCKTSKFARGYHVSSTSSTVVHSLHLHAAMSVLAKFQGSRCLVTLPEDIISNIGDETRHFNSKAFVFISSDAISDDTCTMCGKQQYIVQRWLNDWDCFVDETAIEEIKGGDRLAVIQTGLELMELQTRTIQGSNL